MMFKRTLPASLHGLRALDRRSSAGAIISALAFVLLLWAPDADASGYRDFSYGTISAPTSEKPQSKLWFNDGSWYGTMWNKDYVAPGGTTPAGRYEIHKLSWQGAAQSWSSTGAPADTRRTSYSDAVSDSSHVWIASAVTTTSPDLDTGIKLYRYSYNPTGNTYSLDGGFPVTVAQGAVEAVGIARDSTGVLWMTYTLGHQVWVAHTNGNDGIWEAPYVLPAPNATRLNPDDISSIVAYDGGIGILWSNQFDMTSPGVMGFASHVDGTGDSAANWVYNEDKSGLEVADDHMNLKALPSGDPAGQLVALTKTSFNTSDGDSPLIELDVLGQDGTWAHHTVWTPLDDVTRATLLVDIEHRMLYAFASKPCCSGGVIYHKRTSLDAISWSSGHGTAFIDPSTDTTINNTTSTKQNLTSTTGLLLAAGDDNTRFYMHNTRDLGSDGTPPVTEILGGPEEGGSVRNSSADFRFASNEAGVTFECSLDPADPQNPAFTACPSPYAAAGLTDGPHTLIVRAKDDAGNVDPDPVQRSWTVSATAPYRFTPDADSLVAAGGTVNRGTLGYLEVDGGTHVAERSYLRFTASGLQAAPSHAVLRVWATNGASQSGTGKGSGAYFVPSNAWAETEIVDANAPAPGTALEQKLNMLIPDNSYVDYDVSAAVTGNGTYSFALVTTQTDKLTFDSREAARPPQLLITEGPDVTPPDTTVDSGPTGAVRSSSATFTFSSTDSPAGFECAVDGAAFAPCTSPLELSSLADGAHQLQVRSSDALGNTDATPAERFWTVDTKPPGAPIITSPADGSQGNSSDVTLSGSAEAGATVTVLDGSTASGTTTAAGDGSWSKTVPVADGEHVFTATAADALGNTSAPSASVTTIVDTTAPTTQILSGPSGTTSSTGASLTYSSSASDATFECSLDGAAYAACSADGASYSGLSDGSHTFSVRSIDSVGNVDASPPSRTWIVDTTAPNTTVTSGPSGVVVSRSATFGFSSTETPSTFECSLDGAPFAPCSPPQTYTGLGAGAHAFDVRATDGAGNQDATPAGRSWSVNTTAFDDTFDGAGAAFASWTTVKWGKGATARVESGIGVGGTKAAHLAAGGQAGAYAYAAKNLGAPQADLTASGDFRSATEGLSGIAVPLLRLLDVNGVERAAVLRVNGTGRLQVRHVGATTVTTTTTTALALNAYGHIELHVVGRGAGASTVEVKLGGTTIFTTATANVPVAGVRELRIGTETKKLLFDQIVDNILATI